MPQFQFVDETPDEPKNENLDYTYSDSGYFGDPVDQHQNQVEHQNQWTAGENHDDIDVDRSRWTAGENHDDIHDDIQPNNLSLQFQHDNERLN